MSKLSVWISGWQAPSVCLAALVFLLGGGCEPTQPDEPEQQVEADEGAEEEATLAPAPDSREAICESVEEGVDTVNDERIAAQRREVVEGAVDAVAETQKALRALVEDRPEDALSALERATGKLELVLARSPDLALAPISVSVYEQDVLATLEAIERARQEANEALDDGRVQVARRLLGALVSQLELRVTSIPLATYPDAIRAAVPLIDEGDHEAAVATLGAALRTLVVTEHVIPLPIVRAEVMLAEASDLAENEERSEDENTRLAQLLENATYQVRLAEALGYGTSDDYVTLYAQLTELGERTEGGQSGTGLFDDIESTISGMRERIFDESDSSGE